MEFPDKFSRPSAFDFSPQRYQWRAGRIPESILHNGNIVSPNPLKDTAIFVVHGIGDQKDTETAVAMRWGIEDTLPLVEPQNWHHGADNQWILPAPYINDGHWAQYDDLKVFEDDIRDDMDTLTRRQLEFFSNAWRSRTLGWFRSWSWIVRQGYNLILRGTWYKKPFYILLTVLVGIILLLAGLWPGSRRFVVTYVNDARLYMEPRGDVEHEIVQLIERRVARGFLKTIGLDMDLNEIPGYEGVLIAGKPHHFKKVVWTAHSLGTVISVNVIGDILWRCLKLRTIQETDDQRILARNCAKAERIENSLVNFITFGSPIDKVCFLYGMKKAMSNRDTTKKSVFKEDLAESTATKDADQDRTTTEISGQNDSQKGNSVIRRWPAEYLPNGILDITDQKTGPWWINVFYGSDPISGPLDTIDEYLGMPKRKFFTQQRRLVTNISTLGMRIPLASHTGYWRDKGLVATILSRTFFGYTKEVCCNRYCNNDAQETKGNKKFCFRCWPEWMHGLLSSMGLFWIVVGVTTLIILGVYNWDKIKPWIEMFVKGSGG